ncbi:OmpA family protein [Vreelandella utahensis]|uniref:OmpA family protein n=1 Tax=Vreelandella halophila TaxID=86177 RepID=UPI0015C381CA|nr:OmpA family protein [Halomonas utahensis]
MDFANGWSIVRKALITYWLFLVAAPGALATNELNWETFNNSIFDRSRVVGTDVELVTGPMVYQEEEDEHFTEGYRPESSRELAGARKRREVYDLPRVWGAAGVFSWTLARLKDAGFEPVFQCEESACGDVAAWRLYLSDLVAGPQKGQHYVLARTSNESGWSVWVAAYVNEFDGQTRLILDHVVPSQTTWSDKHFLSRGTIRFSPGVAEADESALANLGRAVEQVGSLEDGKLVILGNTDAEGSLFMNIWLSGLRARNVRDYLATRDGLSADNLIVKPFSSLLPRENNGSPNGRRENRRVDVLMAN